MPILTAIYPQRERRHIVARPQNTNSKFGFSESQLNKPLVGPSMGMNEYRRQNGLLINGGLQGWREQQMRAPTDFTRPEDGSLEGYVEKYLAQNGATDPKHPQHAALIEKGKAEFFALPQGERVKYATVKPGSVSTPATGLAVPDGAAIQRTIDNLQKLRRPAPLESPGLRRAVKMVMGAASGFQEQNLKDQGSDMQQRGLVSMSPTTRTFQNGATITQQQPGVQQPATLQSPYGTGSVTFGPKTTPTLIEGKPASQWFADAAGRQGVPNRYATPNGSRGNSPLPVPTVAAVMPVTSTPQPNMLSRDDLAGSKLSPRAERVVAAGPFPVAVPFSETAINNPVNGGMVVPKEYRTGSIPVISTPPSPAAPAVAVPGTLPAPPAPKPGVLHTTLTSLKAIPGNAASTFGKSPFGEAVGDVAGEVGGFLKAYPGAVKSGLKAAAAVPLKLWQKNDVFRGSQADQFLSRQLLDQSQPATAAAPAPPPASKATGTTTASAPTKKPAATDDEEDS